MRGIMDAAAALPRDQPGDQPAPVGGGGPEIKIAGERIQIGERFFDVKIGQSTIIDPLMLERIRKILTSHVDSSIHQAITKVTAGAPQGQKSDVKIAIGKEGVTVQKVGREEKEVLSIKEEKKERTERSVEIFKTHQKLKQEITSYCKRNKFSTEDVKQALANIRSEVHPSYIHFAKEEFPTDWPGRTLYSRLQDSENEALYLAFQDINNEYTCSSPDKKSKLKECEKYLRLVFANETIRPPNYLERDGATVVQHTSRGKCELNFEDPTKPLATINSFSDFADVNRGIPSAADDKTRSEHIKKHNPNMGGVVIKAGMPGFQGTECIVSRSGRSDSKERIVEETIDALLNQLGTSNAKGITNENDKYFFTHAITTHMDIAWEKTLGTKENERESIVNMLEAIQDWPPEGYKVVVAGKEIYLKKPIIREQRLSSTVTGVKLGPIPISDLGAAEEDKINFIANQRLFERDFLKDDPVFKNLKESLLKKLDANSFEEVDQATLFKNGEFFSSEEYKNYVTFVEMYLKGKAADDNLTAKALYCVMFHKYPDTGQVVHPADVELFSNIAYDSLNISCAKQCKSGKDRTGISVALKVAQRLFENKFDRKFIPPPVPQSKDTLWFKKFYREALFTICMDTTVESQGFSGFKWAARGGNPNAMRYLYNDADVTAVKNKGIDDVPRADVTVEDESKLFSEKVQHRAMYGAVEKADRNRLLEVYEQTRFQRSQAKPKAEKILSDLLGAEIKLDDSLHLVQHIKTLKITGKQRIRLIDRYGELMDKFNTLSPQDKLVCYALHCIIDMYERRRAIKDRAKASDSLKDYNKVRDLRFI
jgi:hypothetical protein